MNTSYLCDVAVIGAGIGGYTAAIRSSQLGKKVFLIEKGEIGGTCLNYGCIPTATLLKTAQLIHDIRRCREFGLKVKDFSIDLQEIMKRKNTIISRHVEGLKFLLKKNRIQLISGVAKLASKNEIRIHKVDGTEVIVRSDDIIIATGSEENSQKAEEVMKKQILTTKEALDLEEIPEDLAVVGGDIEGIELAVIFNAFGSKVIVLEKSLKILPSFDKDIGRTFHRILRKRGIEVHVDTAIEGLETNSEGKIEIKTFSKGKHNIICVEKVLITNNRKPLTEALSLEETGIMLKDGFVIVDKHMRTNIQNIYAVGDVVGKKMFAHSAMAEGIVAAENICGLTTKMDYKHIASCLYGCPEIASVGLSEEEARIHGRKLAVGKFSLLANGKASTLGETDGFTKVICDEETGEILGIHLVGPHVTEIIGEAALAQSLECTSEEIVRLIHPHPTISETIVEAVKDITKSAIHS